MAPDGELDLATDACCGCHADGARLCRHSAKLLHSGAAFLGTTRANVLMLLGVCKLLALLDLWVVNAIPRVTCLCVACMMGAPSATYHGVLASHQYLCRVLAHTGHAHACILTGLPTDLAGLVTYCHHAIADDLPPPALMCADMLFDARTPTELAI